MDSHNIKKCQCGSDAVLRHDVFMDAFYVKCKKCNKRTKLFHILGKQRAIEAWNKEDIL